MATEGGAKVAPRISTSLARRFHNTRATCFKLASSSCSTRTVGVDVDVEEAQYIINFESTVDKPFLFPKNNIDIYVNFDILSWHRCGISL